jgi:hydroxymethylpyrimidine/phosphomethylpyrimidine kinase
VIIKGSHLEPRQSATVTDYLVHHTGASVENSRERIHTPHSHGTGCSFASALTSYYCQTGDLARAFSLSCDYMEQLLRKGQQLCFARGQKNGPLPHGWL